VRPQLKGVVWERVGDELRLVYDRRDQLLIADPDGAVEALLELLREGGRTVSELATALRIEPAGVANAIAEFDACGLLEDGERLGALSAGDAERYFSNLLFFESFASMGHSREDFQRALREAHVLVLGTGGLNSNTLPHLCGLGVGRLTLLDRDVVMPRNFARQFLYRWDDIGAAKVDRAADWVRAFDPNIQVSAIQRAVDGPDCLVDLLDRVRPDVVAAGIDAPDEVDKWVNAACVGAGVPYVRGGMYVTEGLVWSVAPGNSACLRCVPDIVEDAAVVDQLVGDDSELEHAVAGLALHRTKPRTNRGIGPVAGLLGALGAFEILRYLTGFESPVYAGRPLSIDFAAGCAMRQTEWRRDPACVVCGTANPTSVPRSEPAAAGVG
jgi:molybdopterin/thiamine biosynthesis adenylyltransferase